MPEVWFYFFDTKCQSEGTITSENWNFWKLLEISRLYFQSFAQISYAHSPCNYCKKLKSSPRFSKLHNNGKPLKTFRKLHSMAWWIFLLDLQSMTNLNETSILLPLWIIKQHFSFLCMFSIQVNLSKYFRECADDRQWVNQLMPIDGNCENIEGIMDCFMRKN